MTGNGVPLGMSIAVLAALIGGAWAAENAAPVKRFVIVRWNSIGPERRWRTIMFLSIALAVIGRAYRSDDYLVRETWLYSNLFSNSQLFYVGVAMTLVGAYFWLGARWTRDK